jgi:hypothetical protein
MSKHKKGATKRSFVAERLSSALLTWATARELTFIYLLRT